MGQKTKITLLVNAREIFEKDNPSEDFILERCALSSGSSLLEGRDSNGDWKVKVEEITIDEDANVRWEGTSIDLANSGFDKPDEDWDYDVAIESIVYQYKEENYFDRIVINGTGGRHGKVTQKSKKRTELPPEIEVYDYTIIFTIYGQGNDSKSFSIDPKLKIPPK